MVLGTDDVRVTFVYAAHGSARLTFTSVDPDLPLCVKIADVGKCESDESQMEFVGILPEWLIPRVYGIDVQHVFDKNISTLLAQQEQMTVRTWMTLLAETSVTVGT